MHLRGYQESGVLKLLDIIRDRGSAYLADEMGLGKTAQAFAVARALPGSTLIVCPASLRLNSEREWKLWNPDATVSVILKGSDIKKWNSSAYVTVVSYDLVAKKEVLNELRKAHFDLLILDEVHFCKNEKSLRTKACLSVLWACSKYQLVLSGTPFPNGIMDGFTVFNKLAPEMFPDKYRFGFKYTNAERNWFTGHWEFKGGKNLKELRTKIKGTFMVRRTKAAVLKELPPKIYSKIPMSVTGLTPDMTLSEEALSAITKALAEGQVAALSDSNPTQRRALGLKKIPAIVEHVRMLLEEKQKLVLFAYHTEVIEALQLALKEYGIVVLQGKTTPTNKQRAVDAFQTNPEVRVFLGQITAAGIGITLTAADICVFGEYSWVPAEMAQAVDRLHRIGQEHVVEVQYLVAAKSMDEQLIDVLADKIANINEALRS